MNNTNKGFTVLELLTVVAIIGFLSAIAFAGYQQYTMRARAADILVKYDAIRSGVQTQLASAQTSPTKTDDCTALANGFSTSNLTDEYVRLAVGFEAVSGGYRPVLNICAKSDASGTRNVQVAKGAYDTMVKVGSVEKNSVITDTVVSFALPLTSGDAPYCKAYTIANADTCAMTTSASLAAKLPAAQVSAPASATAATPSVPPVPHCTAATLPQQVERKVMAFGPQLTGHVMNDGNLNTGGDMREFTTEMAIVGGAQVTAAAGHGATIFSYATQSQTNEFLVWNPSSITIEMKNVDYDTHVNINDGLNHRLTTTWQSASGALVLYDNGKEVWRGSVNKGGVIGGNGKLVLGQDQDSYGGGFGTNDAFQGKIITASLASAAATGTQVSAGPIQTVFNANNGLITNVVLDANGRPIDTTQRHTYTAGGSMSTATERVDTTLYVSASCN